MQLPPPNIHAQGPISSVDPCRYLSDAPLPPQYQNQHQHPRYLPGDLVSLAPEPAFTQSQSPYSEMKSPTLDYEILNNLNSFAASSQYAEIEGSALDYDILNNLNYLDSPDFGIGFPSDFVLLPMDQSFIQDPVNDGTLFPDLDELLPQSSPDIPPPPPPPPVPHKHRCSNCSRSFARKCELDRHTLRYTKPFRCTQPGCGAAFAEKRRCLQHILAVHEQATQKDLRKCHSCPYSSIRPDALKRHIKLKHRDKSEGSQSTASSELSGVHSGRRRRERT